MNPLKAFVGTLTTTDKNIVQKPSEPIYDIKIDGLNGETLDLSKFKGKYLLFVNVASKCGYTPQYKDLQKLHETYKEQLIVIGVPCNQFGSQEPGDSKEIQDFCELNYGVSFPITEKVDVKGDKQHALYKWLTSKSVNGRKNSKVKWNFQKYLVSPSGEFIDYFYSITRPTSSRITSHLK